MLLRRHHKEIKKEPQNKKDVKEVEKPRKSRKVKKSD